MSRAEGDPYYRFAPAGQVTRGILAHYDPAHVRGGEPALVRLYMDCLEEMKGHRLEYAAEGMRGVPRESVLRYSMLCLRTLQTAAQRLRIAIAAEAAAFLDAAEAPQLPDIGRLRISRLGAKRRHPYEGGPRKRPRG